MQRYAVVWALFDPASNRDSCPRIEPKAARNKAHVHHTTERTIGDQAGVIYRNWEQ
jgi:hypothetical protein